MAHRLKLSDDKIRRLKEPGKYWDTEAIGLYVEVLPQRKRSRVEKITLEIPEEAVEGRALLQVGDAISLSSTAASSRSRMTSRPPRRFLSDRAGSRWSARPTR